MTFIIPNAVPGSSTELTLQGQPDTVDFQILGNGPTIITGGTVSAQTSPNNTVQCSQVTWSIDGNIYAAASVTSLSFASNTSGNPRFDLVIARATSASVGSIEVLQGTASANPVFPTPTWTTDSVLAAVYLANGYSSITNAEINAKLVVFPVGAIVGATLGGPPQVGTFNVGNIVYDPIGTDQWVCVYTGGLPTAAGDWQLMLAYDTYTNFTNINTSEIGQQGMSTSMPRYMATSTFTPTSGVLYLCPIIAPAMAVAKYLFFYATVNPQTTISHCWFSIWDGDINLLAITADTTSAWNGAYLYQGLEIATVLSNGASVSASSYTFPNSGVNVSSLYYMGFMMVCGTPGSTTSMPTLVASPPVLGTVWKQDQTVSASFTNSGSYYTTPLPIPTGGGGIYSPNAGAFSQALFASYSNDGLP